MNSVHETTVSPLAGFDKLGEDHWNLEVPSLYEHALRRNEGKVVAGGAFCAETGHHTGRSPKDKHIVVDSLTENTVWWEGNRRQTPEQFDSLLNDFLAHAKDSTLFVQDLYGGCLLYTSPSPRDRQKSRMPSSA